MKITLKRFLFIQSGILDEEQIRNCITDGIKQLNLKCDEESLIINVVKNREGKHFGHTYCWVEDIKIYNALIGLNLDGTERFEEVEDKTWKEPDVPLDEALEGVTDWGEEEEIMDRYDRPYIRKSLEPVIILPGIKYTGEQRNKTESDIGFIDVFPVSLTNYEENENYIFSKNIPDWLDESIVHAYFKKFDDNQFSKNYPKIIIRNYKENRNLKVIFSPKQNNLASFLIKLVKKVELSDQHGNKKLIFFSQGKVKST